MAAILMVLTVGIVQPLAANPPSVSQMANSTALAQQVPPNNSTLSSELDQQRDRLAGLRRELAQQSQDIEKLKLDLDFTRAHAQEQVALIVGLMELFFGVLALVLGIGVVAGWVEGRRIKELGNDAKRLTKEAQQTLEEAKAASSHIVTMRRGIQEAWGEVDVHFDELRIAESFSVLSAARDRSGESSADSAVHFQDADVLLVVADSFNLLADAEKTGKHYIKIARYWAAKSDFERAIYRAQRAGQICPGDFQPPLQLAKTYAIRAELDPTRSSPQRQDDLKKALEAAQRALALQRGEGWESLHQLGWIYDSLEMWDKAVDYYSKSREFSKSEDVRAQISYNLACSLAKASQPERALTELAAVIDVGDNRRKAAEDADFSSLHDDPRFQALIARPS